MNILMLCQRLPSLLLILLILVLRQGAAAAASARTAVAENEEKAVPEASAARIAIAGSRTAIAGAGTAAAAGTAILTAGTAINVGGLAKVTAETAIPTGGKGIAEAETATAAATGSGEHRAACEETAWLTFSTNDLELVAKEHENATVVLQAWGSFSGCLVVNFTYDPANPSIEPLEDVVICPAFPSTSSASPITSGPPLVSTSAPYSSSGSSFSSTSSFFSSSTPPLPFKSSSYSSSYSPISPSSSSFPSVSSSFSSSPHLPHPPPLRKRCRGCRDKPENTLHGPQSTPIHPLPGPVRPYTLRGLIVRRGASGSGRGSAAVANVSLEIVSRWVGKTVLGVKTNSSCVGVTDAFVRVSVTHTRALDVAANVIGWMYTILWDVSFLPQAWLNWRRTSVEGFSLDNVALNFIAYLYYTLFNVSFCSIPFIKEQFKTRYPRSVNHVQANDVFFAGYALFMQVVFAIQCLCYGRNKGLSVSWTCMALVGVSVLIVGVECVLVGVGILWWLDVFYLMSYMKLVITPLKYIPQVYVNYQLRSTDGFSVFGATMDFSGGVLSLLQMFLLSANSNDFRSIFTNFSKFGLGVISLIFDVIYFSQHWYYHLRPWKLPWEAS